MPIMDGTLVTKLEPDGIHNPCVIHAWDAESDNPIFTDICLGVVIERISGENKVTVNWLQQCPYARKNNIPAQEQVEFAYLWEVGQIGHIG